MNTAEIESFSRQLLAPLHALKLDAEYRENTFAVSQAKLALDVVESVTLLHRLDSRQTQLELEPVHLGDIIVRVLASLREYFGEMQIDYELDFQKGVPLVNSDRHVIEHALKMLLYGVQSLNASGAVISIKAHKDKDNNVKCIVGARALDTQKITLHTSLHTQSTSVSSAVDTSRQLLREVGATLRKTQTKQHKGFAVSIPASEQLMLV